VATILNGQGEPGHRAAPARGTIHDANIGGRFDVGEIIKKDDKEFRGYKYQLNKNATDSTLKKLAAEDTHRVWSTADVEIKKDRIEEEAEEAIEDFAAQLERNLRE
jgi:hypothetical protein